jgi:Tol biopolymer transport system component
MAALVGAVAVGSRLIDPPPMITPGTFFAPEEMLVSVDGRVLAIDTLTSTRREVGDGFPLAISPDRTRFASATYGEGDKPADDRLVITEAQGTAIAEIAVASQAAVWSPDGRYLVLDGRLSNGTAYAVWGVETDDVTPLPFTASWDFIGRSWDAPTWAPDSRHLLGRDGASRALVMTDLHGQASYLTREDGLRITSAGSSSPDGEFLLVHETNVPRPCSCLTLLRVAPDLSTSLAGYLPYMHGSSWSPDGRHIAGFRREGIVLVSLDDLSAAAIVHRPVIPGDFGIDVQIPWTDLRWSPDSRRLAFIGWDPSDPTAERNVVLVVDADGGPARVIAPIDPGIWSPLAW